MQYYNDQRTNRREREKRIAKLFYFISHLALKQSSNVEKKQKKKEFIWWVSEIYREMSKQYITANSIARDKQFLRGKENVFPFKWDKRRK